MTLLLHLDVLEEAGRQMLSEMPNRSSREGVYRVMADLGSPVAPIFERLRKEMGDGQPVRPACLRILDGGKR